MPLKKRPNGLFATGAPPKYKTPEEMQKKIEEYFNGGYSTKVKRIRVGKDEYIEKEVPAITITDIVIYLGFADRVSFYDYGKKSDFAYTIKKIRTAMEREYEDLLQENPTGAIFALKNLGWTDKQHIEQTNITKEVTEDNLYDEEPNE